MSLPLSVKSKLYAHLLLYGFVKEIFLVHINLLAHNSYIKYTAVCKNF